MELALKGSRFKGKDYFSYGVRLELDGEGYLPLQKGGGVVPPDPDPSVGRLGQCQSLSDFPNFDGTE